MMEPPLLSLPIELQMAVLRALPDIASLQAALLTHSSLYRAFQLDPKIPAHVLRNLIPPGLLKYALIIYQARLARSESRDKDELSALLDSFYQTTPPESEAGILRWGISLRQAGRMSEVYACVQSFAADLTNDALALVSTDQGTEEPPPSSQEISRIERTLYRFELYWSIFGNARGAQGHFSTSEEKQLYFFRYSTPWENEQLACIHYYLFRRLSTAFDEVAAHDIEWGELPIEWLNSQNSWKAHFMSQGLRYLHQVANAQTYAERHRILNSRLRSATDHLAEDLQELADTLEETIITLPSHTQEAVRTLYSSNRCPQSDHERDSDPDTGPFHTWYYAHQEKWDGSLWYTLPITFEFPKARDALRRRAYVLWDQARASRMACLELIWDPPDGEEPSDEEIASRFETMIESFKLRVEIWMRGGRGWWSKEDTSRVVWEDSDRVVAD